ncbi:hypothetical protein [Mangrovimonas sp. TPBH4]|uniref:hypothetical protein n=1 Tax=Mangrovimonas sp. TPBH4 TaxID=1645914 RepID=UPI0006B4E20D|nr:hypothetical protein [Mangrovimonas sp. TPBH4]
MIFQKVLKGIPNLTEKDVNYIISNTGILSNLLRNNPNFQLSEIKEELTESNLINHLSNYHGTLPSSNKWSKLGKTYGEVSPFISTTAGAVQRDNSKNIIFPTFITAIRFATKNFKTSGCIFYTYVQVLGKESIPLESFSEEVRELHIFKDFLPYHQQGEITAKLRIPSISIEKAEIYNGKKAFQCLNKGTKPIPAKIILNPDYANPEKYCNIRNYF